MKSLLKAAFKEENLFREAAAASIILHLALVRAGTMSLNRPQPHQVEIDITGMIRPAAEAAPQKPAPSVPKPATPPAPPKEWTKSSDNKKVEPAPIPVKPVTPPPETPPSEIPIGSGEGGERFLSALPQLLNMSELSAMLQKFYPEDAREDAREATVVLDIHIGTDGKVNAVDIVQSADTEFNSAAQRVIRLLRFKPAYAGGKPVAVKMRQAIQFKLEH
jgi:TonB family protein